jgi:hypothetical protein
MRPPAAAPSPVGPATPRLALRAATTLGQAATRVARVDPPDGVAGVLRDSPVLVWLTGPVLPGSVSPATLRVKDSTSDVPGRVQASPDGLLLFWQAERLLTPGAAHFVVVSGLRDARGREIPPHLSRFTPCDLVREDITG